MTQIGSVKSACFAYYIDASRCGTLVAWKNDVDTIDSRSKPSPVPPEETSFQPQGEPAGGYRFPVSVIVERRRIRRGRWAVPSWEVTGIVAGEGFKTERRMTSIHRDEECQRYQWSGLILEFFRDATESYWHNLQGSRPSLFVICYEEDDGASMEPILVTADPHEGDAYLETEGTVHAVPIPPDLYRWLEQFVMNHYRPAERKTRKRRKWKENEQRGKTSSSERQH